MVTDNQLNKIMQLRANGRTHQEIADEIGLSRSAIAYQLSKLAEKPIPEKPVEVIIADNFEPNMTTVTFNPHEFEKYRNSQQLYASGNYLFELRGDIIHKTDLGGIVSPADYPEIAEIVGNNPEWNVIPSKQSWVNGLGQMVQHPTHNIRLNPLELYKIQILNSYKQNLANDFLNQIPNDNLGMIKFMATTNLNPQLEYSNTQMRHHSLTRNDPSTGQPNYLVQWAEENKFPLEDIMFCLTNRIENKREYNSLKKSGAQSRQQFDEMKKAGFKTFEEFQRASIWAQTLNSREWLRLGQHHQIKSPVAAIPPKMLAEMDDSGWEPRDYIIARGLGFDIGEKEIHDEIKIKLSKFGLQWNQQNISWARGVNLEHYEGFSTPKAATIYGIIEMSPTSHLRLDSLLIQYSQSSAPGHNISSVEQLHNILIESPFTDICVSNLEGGIVERISGNLVVVEKEVVKEVIIEKEVEKKINPLIDYSGYSQLNSVDDEQNQDIKSAIERDSSKDTLAKAWIRFESNAKQIWNRTNPNISWKQQQEDWEKEDPKKGHAVKLTDYVANLLDIPKPRLDLLHEARIERNEVQHPKGRKLKITIPMITNLLESTEQLIEFLP